MRGFSVLVLGVLFLCLSRVFSQEEDQSQDESILDSIIKVNKDIDLDEGDIVPDDRVYPRNNSDDEENQSIKRNAQRERRRLWTNKIVPYEFDAKVPKDYQPVILAAMEEFHKKTCIRFVRHTTEKNWIKIVHERGCWSQVGSQYWRQGPQKLSIGNGCNSKGVVMHELLHALGFWHEQSRPDRNNFIEILWENIKPGKEHNFRKYSHGRIDTLKRTYDFKSIMHYGNKAFSKNSKPTIQGLGRNSHVQLGQRKAFTNTDVFEVNALYDCSGPSKGWSSWSDYGPCDASCNKIRQRFCASSDLALCRGANSNGVQDEAKKCSNAECYAPVDGHWGRWSSWSSCSSTCGKGVQQRTRQCDDPKPKNGGKQCPAKKVQNQQCFPKRCGMGPDDCEFESGLCSWDQAVKTNRFKWIRRQGATPSSNTGPTGDVSMGRGGKGYYVYVEASSPAKKGDVAKLQSKTFPAVPKGRCLQFAYHMYGSTSMGSLRVYVVDQQTGAKAKIFSKSGDQGNVWHKASTTIFSTHVYKISFEATRGGDYKSDIALDDIFFKNGPCDGIPTVKPTTVSKPTTVKPSTTAKTTTKATTTKPTSKPGTLDCNFNQNMCQWTAVKGTNKFPWQRYNKGTPSWKTGPSSDVTGTGYYVYMETSRQSGSGQTAYLISPALHPTKTAHCLSFYYHMYGQNMGSLNVYIQKPGSTIQRALIFSKSGDQGNKWVKQNITVASLCYYQIVFEGVRGAGYRSDIALDNIDFTEHPCQ